MGKEKEICRSIVQLENLQISEKSQVPNSTNDSWNPRDRLVMAANTRTRKFTCKSENSPNALCMSNTGTPYYQ